MGKIKQGILGGFRGKVGTVVGSYWNGIFYMKALPHSSRKGGKSGKQKMQQGYFKELVTLSMSLSNEDPASPRPLTSTASAPWATLRRPPFLRSPSLSTVMICKSLGRP